MIASRMLTAYSDTDSRSVKHCEHARQSGTWAWCPKTDKDKPRDMHDMHVINVPAHFLCNEQRAQLQQTTMGTSLRVTNGRPVDGTIGPKILVWAALPVALST